MGDRDATDARSSLRDALGFASDGGDDRDARGDEPQRADAPRRRPARGGANSAFRPPRSGGSGPAQVAALAATGPRELVEVVTELSDRVAGLEASLNAALAELAVRVADEAVGRATADVIACVRHELIGFSDRMARALVQPSPSFGEDLDGASWFESDHATVAPVDAGPVLEAAPVPIVNDPLNPSR